MDSLNCFQSQCYYWLSEFRDQEKVQFRTIFEYSKKQNRFIKKYWKI